LVPAPARPDALWSLHRFVAAAGPVGDDHRMPGGRPVQVVFFWLKKPPTAADAVIVRRQTPTAVSGETSNIRTCGFTLTTTGRPCANHVGADVMSCRAGHPCPVVPDRGDGATGGHRQQTRRRRGETPAGPDRGRRAAELLARSLMHDDAEVDGLCADQVLADPVMALALLGSPDAAPAARDAVVQRFGLIGALLVVGYEDRWCRRLSIVSGAGEPAAVGDEVGRHVDRLVRQFADIDARSLESLLSEIDRAEGRATSGVTAKARCRLHATYAIAARDGDGASHHAYMEALDRVLSTTRRSVAS
jgi:hypothetical protein